MSAPSNLATAESIMVSLDRISTDEGAQTRVRVHDGAVRDYAAAMKEQLLAGGLRFPPVVVFNDDQTYWLADGFHRVLAARKAGFTEIAADVRSGSRRDALLFAVSANNAHGLPRTRADMRKLVTLFLADAEWSQWSDREIARRCQVDHKVVSRLRQRSPGAQPQTGGQSAQRAGTAYEMSGNAAIAAAEPTAGEPPPAEAVSAPVAVSDPAGLPIPEARAEVFAALADFREADRLFAQLATLLDHIARGPAGALYRQEMIWMGPEKGFACAALRGSQRKVLEAEPYCSYCPNCQATHPERALPACKKCGGRGWTTRAAFESSRHGDLRQSLLNPLVRR